MEHELYLIRIIFPFIVIGFYIFTIFVEKKLPSRGVSGWRVFRIGGFIALIGMLIVVYFIEVRIGAIFSFFGSIIGGIGLVKLSTSK